MMHLRRSTTAVALAAALALAGAPAALAAPALVPAAALGSLGSLGSLDVGGSLGSSESADPGAPAMETMSNFRDLVSDGYVGEYGPLNTGVFYRANAPIHTSQADLDTLTALGITHSYDMRAQDEIDTEYVGGEVVLPDGVEYVHAPIEFANMTELAVTITNPDAAREFMEDTNRRFVTEEDARGSFAEVLTGLATHGDPQMYHCTSGKDRTGWISYLLLSIAGVDDATIMENYLLSNANLAADNEQTLAMIRQELSEEVADNLEPLLIVDADYIQAGIDQLHSDYADVDDYLTDGLGLSAEIIDDLREKLVG